jgi:hypothetical protein
MPRSVIHKFQLFLNQPYPFYFDSMKTVIRLSLVLSTAVFLFVYIFKPFTYNFEEHRFSFPAISLLNGLLVGLVFTLYATTVKFTFPNLLNKRYWTVAKELNYWFLFLLVIGLANFFLRELIYDNPQNLSFRYLKEEVLHAYLVGSLFVVLFTMSNLMFSLKTTSDKAVSWNRLLNEFREDYLKAFHVTLDSGTSRDNINFTTSDFTFAKVDGNYVEIHLLDPDEGAKCHLIRMTLSEVQEQLKDIPEIIRIHRSYLVNINKVNSVNGNAQGYKLQLAHTDYQIPVSRSYLSNFDAAMKQQSQIRLSEV